MISRALIWREMQAAARSVANYRLRWVAGAAGIFFLWVASFKQNVFGGPGVALFQALHATMLATISIVAPILTADTISREKREGTLDLLFLTPLTAKKIIGSKFLFQTMRMLGLWLVSLPLLMLPLLEGGVDGRMVACSMAVQLTLMWIALVSGLAASLFFVKPLAAVIGALAIASIVCAIDFIVTGGFLSGTLIGIGNSSDSNIFRFLMLGFAMFLAIPSWLGMSKGFLKISEIETTLAWNTFLILVLSLYTTVLLGRALSKRQAFAGESARRIRIRKTFTKPRFWKEGFRRSMNKRMDSNPLIWLEYRSAWSRSGRLVLIFGVSLIETLMFIANPVESEFTGLHSSIAVSILILLALTSSSSFQKERESGAFELLCVAPFQKDALLRGRLRAVWSYYLPAGVCLGGFIALSTWVFGTSFFDVSERFLVPAHLLSIVLSAITLPIAGLYFVFRFKKFVAVLVSTLFIGLLGPLYMWNLIGLVMSFLDNGYLGLGPALEALVPPGYLVLGTVFCHALVAGLLYLKTQRIVRVRDF